MMDATLSTHKPPQIHKTNDGVFVFFVQKKNDVLVLVEFIPFYVPLKMRFNQ